MRLLLPTLALAVVPLLACQQPSGPSGASLARPAFTSADLPDDPAAHLERRIVVDFVDGTTKAQWDALEGAWGIDLELNDAEEGPDSAITVGELPEGVDGQALLAAIRADPTVEAAEPSMEFKASFVPNDPLFASQWNLKLINAPEAWDTSRGKGVTVAIIDTGVAYEDREDFRQVPDLKGVTFVPGFDFVGDDAHPNDDHGHGTHVAGTVAQATNNGEGVAGVAFQASLMPIKVLDSFGSGQTADIADAVRWAADHGAQVINMSLGGGGRSLVLENAVAYARKKGVVVVCAAGNGGRGVVEYPAAYPASVAVAAIGPTGEKTRYSSWGKELDIAAPGGDTSRGQEFGILQNTIDPRDVSKSIYASWNGTSMAAPHVAAVAALLWAAGARTPDQVEQALFRSARPAQGTSGWTDQYGHGLLDARGALKALSLDAPAGLLPPLAEAALAGPAPTEGPPTAVAQEAGTFAYAPVDFLPLAWAAALLAVVLLTLARKERPGYLNVLVAPGFLVPLVLTTTGVFFVQYFLEPGPASTLAVLPLPDWLSRLIFGRGSLANPLVYSALVPLAVSLLAVPWRHLRPVAGGLALGFAGVLAYSAWAQAPALAWLPFTFLAIPWLAVNALVCLVVARALLRREAA